jgi:hypothetical protein
MIDIIFPIGPSSELNDWELRIALRSIAENVDPALLDRIIIIGRKPGCVSDKVHHIPFPDPFKRKRESNITLKLAAAAAIEVGRGTPTDKHFVWWNDDQFALSSIESVDDFGPYTLPGRMVRARSKWRNNLNRTMTWLRENGHTHHRIEGHIPHLINYGKAAELLAAAWDRNFINVELYHNVAETPVKKIRNHVFKPIWLEDYRRSDIKKVFDHCMFTAIDPVSSTDPNVIEALRERFPNPSIYEVPHGFTPPEVKRRRANGRSRKRGHKGAHNIDNL